MKKYKNIFKISVHEELKKYDESPKQILYPDSRFYRKYKKNVTLKNDGRICTKECFNNSGLNKN